MQPHNVYAGHQFNAPQHLTPVAPHTIAPIQEAATKGLQRSLDSASSFEDATYDRMEYTLDQERKQYLAATHADIRADSTRRLSLPNGHPDAFYDEMGQFRDAEYKDYLSSQLARLDGLDTGYIRPDSSQKVRENIANIQSGIASELDLKIAANLAPRARDATLKLARFQEEQGDYDLAAATINGAPDYAFSPLEKHIALTGIGQNKILSTAKTAAANNDFQTYHDIVSDSEIMGSLTPSQQQQIRNLEKQFLDTDGYIADELTPETFTGTQEEAPTSHARKKTASQIVGLPLGVTDDLVNLYDSFGGDFSSGEARRQAVEALDTFASSFVTPNLSLQDQDLFRNIAAKFSLSKEDANNILKKYSAAFGQHKDFDFQAAIKNISPAFFVSQTTASGVNAAIDSYNSLLNTSLHPKASKQTKEAHAESIETLKNRIAALQADSAQEQENNKARITKLYTDWLVEQDDPSKLTSAELRMKLFDIADSVMDEANNNTYPDSKWDFSTSTEYRLAQAERQKEQEAAQEATTRRQILDAATLETDKNRVLAAEAEERYAAASFHAPLQVSLNTIPQDSAKLPETATLAYIAVPKGDPLAGRSLTIRHNRRTRSIPCREENVSSPTLSSLARAQFGLSHTGNFDILCDASGKAIFINNAVPTRKIDIYNTIMQQETGSKIAVHSLPAGDGGGKWEVAGINIKHHPAEAKKLRSMIKAGASQEQLSQEVYSYYQKISQPAYDLISPATTNKGIELFLRDCSVNHGNGDASEDGSRDGFKHVLYRALNVSPGTNLTKATADFIARNGESAFLAALSKGRAEYYTAIAANNPAKRQFLKGWLNRNRNITQAAYSLIRSK